MLYKTIVLEMLQQHQAFYDQLRQERSAMQALDLYSGLLKTSHEAWKERLMQEKPGMGKEQIASTAMELALKELESHFPTGSEESETLSLEEAMAFVRKHLQPA